MPTLRDYAGILSHHVKLVADSGISPDQLQSLHASGLFSDLLQTLEPHRVDREALRSMLKIHEQRTVSQLHGLCRQKLERASLARARENLGCKNNWFDCMNQASELLRAIYRELHAGFSVETQKEIEKKTDAIWQPFSERYHAEASALILKLAYGRIAALEDAHARLLEAMKSQVPCYVCEWRGSHNEGLSCKACGGTKLLGTSIVTCPRCCGSGIGLAYAPSPGDTGYCPCCLDSGAEKGKIVVDSLGKQVLFDVLYTLKLRPTH